MLFAAPLFLWFLPLAGLPVLFHLLMKRREKRMEFPSLMFFMIAAPRMHAMRRLRELLLLAARVMLLLLLPLVLARPTLKKFPGDSGRMALAIVIDNSASMASMTPGGQSKLEFAREAALQLVNAMDEKSMAALTLTVADPALEPVAGLTADRDLLKERIERIRRTEARGAPADAFSRARAILDQAPPDVGRAVHFFTDLHAATWNRDRPDGTVFDNTAVIFHRIPSARGKGANIAVESVDAPGSILLPGHAFEMNFVLRNNSDFTGNVRVNILNSQGDQTFRTCMIGPEMSETLPYSFIPEAPGYYWVMLELEGDEFRGDNRAGAAFLCKPEAEVLFIGDRQDYGLIPTAVSPTGTGRYTSLRPVFETLENSMQTIMEQPPPMIIGTWHNISDISGIATETLRKYIEAGGQLLVVPPAAERPDAPLNPPTWLGATPGLLKHRSENPAVARTFNRDADAWKGLHNAFEHGALRFFLLHKYSELKLEPDFQILAGPDQRTPVMAWRKLGKGRVYVSGIAFDTRWTPLATDPSGAAVVMLHNMIKDGVSAMAGPQNLSVVAGEHIHIPPGTGEKTFIRSLIGDTVNTPVMPGATPVLARAGAYRIDTGSQTYLVSVRGAAGEGSEVFLESENLALLGDTPHHVLDIAHPEHDATRMLHAHFMGRPLYLPLALLAILVWAAEAWLSSISPRAKRKNRRP